MKLKYLKSILPELFILASIIYYWIASSLLNPFAIGLFLIMSYQIVKQKYTSGIIIGIIFIILNLYMVLALISELSEFENSSKGFYTVLVVGSLYLGFNLVMGCIMLIKYLKKANAKQLQQTIS